MNFRQVEAFNAVMIAGTVTAAADMLFITQPAVTRLVANLEREIGFKLFERKHNRLIPTAEGQNLYLEVKRSFVRLEQIVNAANEIRNMEAGFLKIVATPMMAYGILPRIIGAFNADFPKVHVELDLGPRPTVIQHIASQRYDIAIDAPNIKDPAITECSLSRTKAVCVLPSNHPLADQPVITAKDLEGESFVSLPITSMFRLKTDEVFRNQGIKRKLMVEAHTQQCICNLVAAGVGVSVVGPYVIEDMKGLPIVFRPFQPTISVEYALLYPSLRPTSMITKKFAGYVTRYFDLQFPSSDP